MIQVIWGHINHEKSMNAILNTNFPNLTVFVERYKPFSDLISGAAEEDISNFIHNCQDMEMEGRCPEFDLYYLAHSL